MCPGAADVKANKLWIAGLADATPHKVPSPYMIADALIMLDQMCGGDLYKKNSVVALRRTALQDAGMIRKTYSYGRHLWRCNKSSQDSRVSHFAIKLNSE
jgi:hypothetical protein